MGAFFLDSSAGAPAAPAAAKNQVTGTLKTSVVRLAKWGIGASVIGGLLWFNRGELAETLRHGFDASYILLAAAIYLAGVVLTCLRWHYLVRSLSLPIRRVDALRLGFVSYFFSTILPGSIGGDLVKAGLIAREQRRRTIAISSIIMDRVIGLYGLFLLAGLAGILFWADVQRVMELRLIIYFVWAVVLGGVAAFLVMAFLPVRADPLLERLGRLPRGGRILSELLRAAQLYRRRALALVVAAVIAFIGHIGFVYSFYCSAEAVGPPIPSVQEHFLIVPVGMVVQSVPLTPGNIGVSEGAYEFLYRLLDSPGHDYRGKGVMAALAMRLVSWIVALVSLIFYLPLRGTVRQVIEEELHHGQDAADAAAVKARA